jgi:hypothetical protein
MSETRLETFSSAVGIVMGMGSPKKKLYRENQREADGRNPEANEKLCPPKTKKKGQSTQESMAAGGTKMTERQIYKREQSVYEGKMILGS